MLQHTGERETAALLLELGFPIGQGSTDYERPDCPRGCKALFVAVFHGNTEVVRQLLA
jgi:hypothetical protein